MTSKQLSGIGRQFPRAQMLANVHADPIEAPSQVRPKGAYTVAEFCRTYGIGHTFFYNELKSGRLSARKAGAKTLVLFADAERWASSLPTLAEAA